MNALTEFLTWFYWVLTWATLVGIPCLIGAWIYQHRKKKQ